MLGVRFRPLAFVRTHAKRAERQQDRGSVPTIKSPASTGGKRIRAESIHVEVGVWGGITVCLQKSEDNSLESSTPSMFT